MIWLPLMAGLLGLGIVLVFIRVLLNHSGRMCLPGRSPDLHHTHKAPVPRLGGIALAAAFVAINLLSVLVFPRLDNTRDQLVIVGTSLAMFGLGLRDDLKPLGAKRKLLGQVLIAVVVCCFGIGISSFKIPFSGNIISLGSWGVLLTILWLVGMTNLINLIDGVDGLAGGISLMPMALLAYVGHQNGDFELLAPGMVGALMGFLWFNFPPARIYLGDSGAYFLGFQIGLLALVSSHKGTVVAALVAPLFVLALPIVDTLLAILRRGLRGLPIFRPDRKHIHHRLLESGFSRRKVVLSIYAVTVIFLLLGLLAFVSGGQLIPAALGIGVLILLLCAGKLDFSREWFAVGRVLGNSLDMRQEVQYALSLTRWLALEGGRQPSIDSLWSDLVFATRRLGFSTVKLTLADGARVWQDPAANGETHCFRQELRGGRSGLLELKAPARWPVQEAKSAVDLGCFEKNDLAIPAPISDPNLFEILSELVAEGWLKATQSCEEQAQMPLRFSSALFPSRKPRRGSQIFAYGKQEGKATTNRH